MLAARSTISIHFRSVAVLVPWADLWPRLQHSNICKQLLFLLPIIARSDGSKYKHAHFIPGWGYNARVFFNKQAKNTMALILNKQVPKKAIYNNKLQVRYSQHPPVHWSLFHWSLFRCSPTSLLRILILRHPKVSKYYNDYQIQLNTIKLHQCQAALVARLPLQPKRGTE